MTREVKVGAIYQHYKGDLYIIEGLVRHSETGEKMVVYRALYGDCELWVRPYELFIGKVEVDGKTIERFEEVRIESKREKLN